MDEERELIRNLTKLVLKKITDDEVSYCTRWSLYAVKTVIRCEEKLIFISKDVLDKIAWNVYAFLNGKPPQYWEDRIKLIPILRRKAHREENYVELKVKENRLVKSEGECRKMHRIRVITGEMMRLDADFFRTESRRFRGVVKNDAELKKIEIEFFVKNKISNEIDVDKSIRHGIMIWFGIMDACNHYQVYWRRDSRFDGKCMVGTQIKKNENITDKKDCAGSGYFPLGKKWRVEGRDIFDGKPHNLIIEFIGDHKYVVYCDHKIVLEVEDEEKTFDSNDFGFRTDNIDVNVIFNVT